MNNLIKLLKFVFQLLLGCLIALPLAFLIKKQRNLISFIGRDNGIFTDNVKYFFLFLHHLKPDGIEYYFITENRNTYIELKKLDFPVLIYPSFKSIYVLLRSYILIVDNWMWINKLKYHFLHRAKKIQIWHGVPIKKIQLMNRENIKRLKSASLNLYCKSMGLFPKYDLIISTSNYYTENAFKKAFKTTKIIESGYPRNDCFFNKGSNLSSESKDIETTNKVSDFKDKGYKIVVYVPTFRDTGGDAVQDKTLDLYKLSKFAERHKILFVFKFHPDPYFAYHFTEVENILLYDSSSDIYPLLPSSDCIITDYSSIYFDYLLLDKPIIFYPYDYEKYIKYDRDLIFDYNTMTPGPKCYTQEELQNEIYNILVQGNDHYSKERETLQKMAFKYNDGNASERIWNVIKEKYLS